MQFCLQNTINNTQTILYASFHTHRLHNTYHPTNMAAKKMILRNDIHATAPIFFGGVSFWVVLIRKGK